MWDQAESIDWASALMPQLRMMKEENEALQARLKAQVCANTRPCDPSTKCTRNAAYPDVDFAAPFAELMPEAEKCARACRRRR